MHAITSCNPMLSIRSSSIRLPSVHTPIFVTTSCSTTHSRHACLPMPGRSVPAPSSQSLFGQYTRLPSATITIRPSQYVSPIFHLLSSLITSPTLGQSLLLIARHPCSHLLQTLPFGRMDAQRQVCCYAFRVQLACMYVRKNNKVLANVSRQPLRGDLPAPHEAWDLLPIRAL